MQDNSDDTIYMYFTIMILGIKSTDNENWWQGHRTTENLKHCKCGYNIRWANKLYKGHQNKYDKIVFL